MLVWFSTDHSQPQKGGGGGGGGEEGEGIRGRGGTLKQEKGWNVEAEEGLGKGWNVEAVASSFLPSFLPPRWPCGYGVRLESRRSGVRIPLATKLLDTR